MDQALTEFFRKVERRDFFVDMAAGLALQAADREPSLEMDHEALCSTGYTSIEGLVPADQCNAMTALLGRLVASGVPPLFAYVYDAFWTPGARLLPLLAPTLEVPELLDDVWAWLLPATAGARGWAPHRGNSVLERRDDGRPLMLNVWIALTDTDADHACMHLVPKTKDPDYPHALRQSTGVAQGVPVPLRAGSALLWDANVLHWGGTMSPDARRPRASFSYTVRAADAPPLVPPQRTTASHEERLGTIARQILRYEPQAKELGALVRQWAAITHGMAAVAKNKP